MVATFAKVRFCAYKIKYTSLKFKGVYVNQGCKLISKPCWTSCPTETNFCRTTSNFTRSNIQSFNAIKILYKNLYENYAQLRVTDFEHERAFFSDNIQNL